MKEILINTLAEKTGVDSVKLQNRLGIESTSPSSSYQAYVSASNKTSQSYSISKDRVRPLIEQAIEILIDNPELRVNIGQSVLDELSRDPETELLFDLLVWTRDAESVDQERVLKFCREKLNYQVSQHPVHREVVLSIGELSKELEDIIKKILITIKVFRRSELLSNLTKKSLQDLTEDEKKILSNSYKKPIQ